LVTSHDAFQYFGDAFGWQVRGIQGISTAAEASVSAIQAVAELVVSEGIPVIFVESSVPRATVEAVIAAARARGAEVRLGVRELYSDAMGAPSDFGGTYIEMIVHNVVTILQSFGYAVPSLPESLGVVLPEDFQIG
jgi:manganese/zinc/iron transport system substrate-binding protein